MAALQLSVEGQPSAPSRSFADILTNNDSSPIKIKPPSTFCGEPAVMFSQDEVKKLAAPFKHALVGKFSYGQPNMEQIRRSLTAIGFTGSYSIGHLNNRHILIHFSLEEDSLRCWLRGSWLIQEFFMRVFKWSVDFRLDSEPSHAPVWVALHALPVHLFDKVALFTIASAIGNPLKIDAATATLARPNVARVCVDVDLCRDLPRRIWISMAEGGFW